MRSTERCGLTTAYVYAPRRPAAGVYLVVPGLHFLGPNDPRLDRFCRVLAASGLWVVAPFLRSFSGLLLDDSAFADGRDALALARSLADERALPAPAVFSISFGSLIALSLAASSAPPRAAILFGGYADFVSTVRFAITGRTSLDGEVLELTRDPLNSPVVFLNLLSHLELEGDRQRLAAAWLEMVYRTWGKMELKAPGARDPIAARIASRLPSALHEPFHLGCCLQDGYERWLDHALEAGARDLSFLDATRFVAEVKCPVTLVHGRDDDVIPYSESIKLSRALPSEHRAGLHLTGLYSHTGASAQTTLGLVREAWTLAAMLRDMARAAVP